MSRSVKGTRTEKNLLTAFAGESQARNRYAFFASQVKKEGCEQIANIFTGTAGNDKEHAEVFFKYLEGGHVGITAAYPGGVVGKKLTNLKAGADGEKMEWSQIYLNFDSTAREQGFEDIGASFEEIAEAEEFHEGCYRKLAANVAAGEVLKRKTVVKRHCTNCGYIREGTEAPIDCPACEREQAYYGLWAENY